MEHFTPGEKVLAATDDGRWLPATVLRDAPYPKAHTGGAYIFWDHASGAPQWVSSGGWHSQNTIKRIEQCEVAT